MNKYIVKKKDYDWLYGIGFLLALGILGSCLTAGETSSPTPTLISVTPSIPRNGSQFQGYSLTAQVELTQWAQDEEILKMEYLETQAASSEYSGCPDGCIAHPLGCDIKGNIAFDTGEKIYHLRGQRFYESTSIDTAYGERWFCTEAEAIANGWRKSYK